MPEPIPQPPPPPPPPNPPSLSSFIHDKDEIEDDVGRMSQSSDDLQLTDITQLRERVQSQFIPIIITLRQENEEPNGDFRLKDLFKRVHVQMLGFLSLLNDLDMMGEKTLRKRSFHTLLNYLREVNREAEWLKERLQPPKEY